MAGARNERALDRKHGPRYPDLGVKIAKLRKAEPYDAKTHGRAVHEAIGRLNRAALENYAKKGYTSPCPCASGTYHNTGKDILAAVGRQNAAHAGTPLPNWYTPQRQQALYEEALAAKRAATA